MQCQTLACGNIPGRQVKFLPWESLRAVVFNSDSTSESSRQVWKITLWAPPPNVLLQWFELKRGSDFRSHESSPDFPMHIRVENTAQARRLCVLGVPCRLPQDCLKVGPLTRGFSNFRSAWSPRWNAGYKDRFLGPHLKKASFWTNSGA